MAVLLLLLLLVLYAQCADDVIPFRYHKYDALTSALRQLSEAHPNRSRLYSIGQSVQGRELWVLEVGEPAWDTGDLRPNVHLLANMHGNEGLGRELLLHLAQFLLSAEEDSDAEDARLARQLVSRTRVHLLPSLNPDGFEVSREGECQGVSGRKNARGFDLNRNFPDRLRGSGGGNLSPAPSLQPETRAAMRWMNDTRFLLGANLHGGALVASFPFEGNPNPQVVGGRYEECLSPDDDVLRALSLSYARRHGRMAGVRCYPGGNVFPDGTTNGAAWYSVLGSVQDYAYAFAGCLQITLELSCCKFPPHSALRDLWLENKLPLTRFLLDAQTGVRGVVRSGRSGAPHASARVWLEGREEVSFRTDAHGRFWRLLLPGKYVLRLQARAEQATRRIQVPQQGVLEIDVTLGEEEEEEEEGPATTTQRSSTSTASSPQEGSSTSTEVHTDGGSYAVSELVSKGACPRAASMLLLLLYAAMHSCA